MAMVIRSGFMRKCDLVAEIYDAGTRGVDGIGGDYPAIVPLLPSGVEASAPHLTWDDRPMKKGEGTFFEIAGCYNRYHLPLSRTVFLGKPTQAFLDAEKATLEGMASASASTDSEPVLSLSKLPKSVLAWSSVTSDGRAATNSALVT